MSWIFISHSTVNKKIATDLCNVLEKNGVPCWIAPRNIAFGKRWPGEIIKGIKASCAMVFVYSDAANSSEQMLRELEEASSLRIPTIMFVLDKSEMADDIRYFVKINQWFDASSGKIEDHFQELAVSLKHFFPVKEEADLVGPEKSLRNASAQITNEPIAKVEPLLLSRADDVIDEQTVKNIESLETPKGESGGEVDITSEGEEIEKSGAVSTSTGEQRRSNGTEGPENREEDDDSETGSSTKELKQVMLGSSIEEVSNSETIDAAHEVTIEGDKTFGETPTNGLKEAVNDSTRISETVVSEDVSEKTGNRVHQSIAMKFVVGVFCLFSVGIASFYFYSASTTQSPDVSRINEVQHQMQVLRDAAHEYSKDHDGGYPNDLSAQFLNYIPVVQIEKMLIEKQSGSSTVQTSGSLFVNPFTEKFESPTLGSEEDLQYKSIKPGHVVYIPTEAKCIIFSIDEHKNLVTVSGKKDPQTSNAIVEEYTTIGTRLNEHLAKYKKLTNDEPNNGPAWFRLGLLTSRTGDMEGALTCFEKSHKSDTTNHRNLAKLTRCKNELISKYVNLGVDYQEKNNFPAAIAEYNKALKVDPKSSVAWLNLAITYQFYKQPSLARNAYLKVLELEPKNTHAKQGLESLKWKL